MTNESGGRVWYGVRCVLKWRNHPDYEERITVWRAESIDDAIELAEREAETYAADIGFDYLGLAQAYETRYSHIEDGSEIFSSIRTSSLAADDYIKQFFATGTEHEQVVK